MMIVMGALMSVCVHSPSMISEDDEMFVGGRWWYVDDACFALFCDEGIRRLFTKLLIQAIELVIVAH